jgi:hypothetical protein
MQADSPYARDGATSPIRASRAVHDAGDPANGQALNLAGMFRVRKRSSGTPTPPSTEPFKKDRGPIYAHLLSLENFGRLLSRKARPQGVAAIPRGEV